MTTNIEQAITLRAAFDIIEESYEFMLAYAAQGRRNEQADADGESQIRVHLRRMQSALEQCEAAVGGGLGGPEGAAFAARFRDDLAVSRSIMALLHARLSVSSEMIDNTNGLIAIRALLTDIFFIDQAVLPSR
jgi:hypothetical protein